MVRLVEAGLAVFLVSGLVWPCSVCQIRISNEEHALCLRSGVELRSSVCDPDDLESKSQADSRHHVSLSYDQTNPQISPRCVAACRAELLRYHTSPASYIFYQIFPVNKFLIFLKFWRSEAREALDSLNTCAMHVNASAVRIRISPSLVGPRQRWYLSRERGDRSGPSLSDAVMRNTGGLCSVSIWHIELLTSIKLSFSKFFHMYEDKSCSRGLAAIGHGGGIRRLQRSSESDGLARRRVRLQCSGRKLLVFRLLAIPMDLGLEIGILN
ncbi:hypothetical protein L207DRAFT_167307 [Hyaloscypha variabilis F]|uniref:RRM domain-containing protein n=1 Tax=Hyaloscypha variabilis (strain UAMH 11265 / GT02V1 / F) TaxID=1149755 RepID=A0A2J6R3U5_HYAVF|nr:hypothetical protein L207DRAFT_167307 [Hyaloscypha variabilis F]